ncbi:uncharacterized protein RCC_03028 [Ramularia collo-cygni]|uniref:Uncharacterized protein n=1 Tax=Ramularia collo-cygni TaxID=112498 RepID=A0A2D3V0Y9_9PEZI|nr:uncharacterized protein RCC_03028 [Ramularia collo-cygni]CZT17196.1 uncharacterized protein RCC_03028 [Ramularia collo-cygni]
MATLYSYYLPYYPYADFYDLVDSWIDVSSQPSSSSLSSIGDEIVTTGLRVQDDPRMKRRRALRPGAPTHLHITRTPSTGTVSSAEEYEESSSESDQVMMSSGEGNALLQGQVESNIPTQSASSEDDDDENKTAINYPHSHAGTTTSFTPLPNAFSHPPAKTPRLSSHPTPGSYFPPSRPGLTSRRSSARYSLPNTSTGRRASCAAQNPLSPSINTAAEHEEILRASLTSLLSVAAAARSLPKGASQRGSSGPRVNPPMSFKLVPESALPTTTTNTQQLQQDEPMFKPTLRRTSTSCSGSSNVPSEHKRRAPQVAPVIIAPRTRSSSGNGRDRKKARLRRSSSTSSEDLLYSQVTPTLFTWVATAGVVVVLSALSFGAGYTVGKEAGRFEGQFGGDVEQVRSCAREAGRSGLGLRRSLARSAVGVV